MTSVERLARSRLGELQQIAKGGQGRVYRATELQLPGESRQLVYKEYRSRDISIAGLDGMASFRERLDRSDRTMLDVLTNWPLRVVEHDDGRAAGVVVPLIPDEFFHELRLADGSAKRRPRDGQYLAQPPERCHRAGVPVAPLGDRYRVCRDLAFAIGFLHKRDICIGDISFPNMAYAPSLSPCVYLVDCDAFRLRGNSPVVPQLHTPDWAPPEGAKVQSIRTDLYKLGLFVLRALSPRELSAQNRDPSWADGALDPRGRHMLRKALATGAGTRRPTAKEWYEHLSGTLRNRRLPTSRHSSRLPPGLVRRPPAGQATA